MDTGPTDLPSGAAQGFLDGVEKRLDTGRQMAVVLAPHPGDDTPEGVDRPVKDTGDWRPLSEVETEAETLVLITPPSFDRETWSAAHTGAPDVEALSVPEEDLKAFREAAPDVPFSDLTDETLEALAPDPDAQIPGTAVRWREATEQQLQRIAEGEPPSEVV